MSTLNTPLWGFFRHGSHGGWKGVSGVTFRPVPVRMLISRSDRFLDNPTYNLRLRHVMSHTCCEGECASTGSQFSSLCSLHQHHNKKHSNTVEEESSLGKARISKRKRDAEDEEERERQQLQVQLELEAKSRGPELEPQQPVCLVVCFLEVRNLSHAV